MGAPQRPLSPSTSPPRAGTWGCPSSASLPAASPNPSARPLAPQPCPPRGVFAAGGADERCPGCAACGLVNSCFVFLWFPLALSEDSMCGLIRAGPAASSSAEAPAASPPAPRSLLALGEAFPRSQLLSPAAAGCSGRGVKCPQCSSPLSPQK